MDTTPDRAIPTLMWWLCSKLEVTPAHRLRSRACIPLRNVTGRARSVWQGNPNSGTDGPTTQWTTTSIEDAAPSEWTLDFIAASSVSYYQLDRESADVMNTREWWLSQASSYKRDVSVMSHWGTKIGALLAKEKRCIAVSSLNKEILRYKEDGESCLETTDPFRRGRQNMQAYKRSQPKSYSCPG